MPQTDHARLSASAAERFMACPGSVALSELLPPEEESEYAAEGTAAHAVAELCLKSGDDAWTMMGQEHYGFMVDAGMVEAVQVYLDYVRECVDDGGTLEVEHELDNTGLGPDFGGTADAVINGIVEGGGYLHVLDYKHGAGIPVEIQYEDGSLNKQLMYYAFGVLRDNGVQRGDKISVGMAIVQPRCAYSDDGIREVWTDSDVILAWGEDELIPAMARVDSDDTPFDSGDHCRWCPAKIVCPKMIEAVEIVSTTKKAELEGFDDETLALRYKQARDAKFMIKAIEAECKKRALAGNTIGGTKLVYGRSSRVFREGAEAAAVELFGDDAYTDPSLKSPAQIEQLPGGKDFAGEWAYKEKGGPTLVGAGDKGEPYDPADAGQSFAEIEVSK